MSRTTFLVSVMTVYALWHGALAVAEEAANGKPAKPTAAESDRMDISELVIGDWYQIDVKRGESQAQVQGTLVKLNNRWIVLQTTLSEGCRGVPIFHDTPILGDLPFFDRYFVNAGGPFYSKCNYWIPREIAAVSGRGMFNPKLLGDDAARLWPLPIVPKADEPGQGATCRVEANLDGTVESLDLPYSAKKGETTTVERTVLATEKVPKFNALPLVGDTFFPKNQTFKQSAHEVPLDDYLFVYETFVEKTGPDVRGATELK